MNDALFHAGTHSGSQFEWEDTPNRLHFYIVDAHHDANGILSYTVGVRSLDGRGATATRRRAGGRFGACRSLCIHAEEHGRSGIGRLRICQLRYLSLVGQRRGTGLVGGVANALAAVKSGGSQEIAVPLVRAGSAVAKASDDIESSFGKRPGQVGYSQVFGEIETQLFTAGSGRFGS